MSRNDDIVQLKQRVIRRRWFLLKDIKRRSLYPPLPQSLESTASSIIGPRAVFIRKAVGFIFFSSFSPTK
jgi:hypothetical protein